MISPRTVYLRQKNQELLNILEENAKDLTRKVELCKDLRRGEPAYRKEDYTEYHHFAFPEVNPAVLNPSSRSKIGGDPVQSIRRFRRQEQPSLIPRRVRSSSADGCYASRKRHSACLVSRTKNRSRSSSEHRRWTRFQQDLASHVHMHGYTLSHSLSKCYCTRKDGGDSFRSNSATVPEPISKKTRIPPRLKEKRYNVKSSKQRPSSVKWSVPTTDDSQDHFPEGFCRVRPLPEDGGRDCAQKSPGSYSAFQSAQGDVKTKSTRASTDIDTPCDHDSDWFLRIKNFRKSNWDDCHAADRRRNGESNCKCPRLYMLGQRQFLEAMGRQHNDKTCCSSRAPENILPPSPRDNIVTLPKVFLEAEDNKLQRKKEETNIAVAKKGREGRSLKTYNINGPCFLTGHKSQAHDDDWRAFVRQRPAESYALRYQKGVDPRKSHSTDLF